MPSDSARRSRSSSPKRVSLRSTFSDPERRDRRRKARWTRFDAIDDQGFVATACRGARARRHSEDERHSVPHTGVDLEESAVRNAARGDRTQGIPPHLPTSRLVEPSLAR